MPSAPSYSGPESSIAIAQLQFKNKHANKENTSTHFMEPNARCNTDNITK